MIAKRLIFLRTWLFGSVVLLFAALLQHNVSRAEGQPSAYDEQAFDEPFEGTEFGTSETEAIAYEHWDGLSSSDESRVYWDDPALKPFDWVRHFGYRHSSTHGRHVGRGLPMEGTSWRNRPYHVDWFAGPLLSDDLIGNQVAQDNELFGGLRLGWDFDYYWGLEWRFGWSNPNIQYNEPQAVADNGSYFVSDIDIVYYPWGDSKIRPYMLFGAGLARIDFVNSNNVNFNTTLFTIPFGGGIQFRQTPWLAWRLEFLDNASFGADGVDSMNNLSFTVGMEFRMGARPASYWPWRSSRKIW